MHEITTRPPLRTICKEMASPLHSSSLWIFSALLALLALPALAQSPLATAQSKAPRSPQELAQTIRIEQVPPSASKPANSSMEARYQEVLRTHFAHEPTVREVQQAAIRYASAEPERAQSWFARSRMANLAPRRVQVRLDRDYKDNRNATSTSGVETSARTDLDDDMFWQYTVEWDFSRLVFNPDTVRVATQAINLAELREDVLNAVTKLFYERRALRLELILNPPGAFEAFTKKRLRIDELTSDLDALTGGAFSRRMRKGS